MHRLGAAMYNRAVCCLNEFILIIFISFLRSHAERDAGSATSGFWRVSSIISVCAPLAVLSRHVLV